MMSFWRTPPMGRFSPFLRRIVIDRYQITLLSLEVPLRYRCRRPTAAAAVLA